MSLRRTLWGGGWGRQAAFLALESGGDRWRSGSQKERRTAALGLKRVCGKTGRASELSSGALLALPASGSAGRLAGGLALGECF